MYKEVHMLILNTYMVSGARTKFNIYIATGITKWFTTFAGRYTYISEPPELCTSYLSNWELMQRVTTKDLIKITKQDSF